MDRISTLPINECGRRALAGIVIGGVTGATFGVVEAAKVSTLSKDWKSLGTKLRDPVVMRFFFRHHLTTTALFGAMFGTYQVMRCTLEKVGPADMDEYAMAGTAAVGSMLPFLPSRIMRRNMPFALMLVGMDVYNGGLRR
jgi:hypothetical protein